MVQFIMLILIIFGSINFCYANEMNIVATIKPIQSIVQYIVGDKAKVKLLLRKNDSLHTYSLRPGDAKIIHSADLVFYINPQMEVFIEKVIASDNVTRKYINLSKSDNLKLFSGREKSFWSDEVKNHDHHEEHHGHHHDHSTDYHLWLDMDNAIALAKDISKNLILVDPLNKDEYEKNLKDFISKAEKSDEQIREKLTPYKNVKFLVFHDAYQYFDKRYDLSTYGTIEVNPFVKPSAKKIDSLRKAIVNEKIKCVFMEPQFSPKLVNVIIDGTKVNTGELDAEWGATGNVLVKDAYFVMMNNLADNMINCFKKD